MSVLTKISLNHSLEKAGALATYFLEKVADKVDIMFSEAEGWFRCDFKAGAQIRVRNHRCD